MKQLGWEEQVFPKSRNPAFRRFRAETPDVTLGSSWAVWVDLGLPPLNLLEK